MSAREDSFDSHLHALCQMATYMKSHHRSYKASNTTTTLYELSHSQGHVMRLSVLNKSVRCCNQNSLTFPLAFLTHHRVGVALGSAEGLHSNHRLPRHHLHSLSHPSRMPISPNRASLNRTRSSNPPAEHNSVRIETDA